MHHSNKSTLTKITSTEAKPVALTAPTKPNSSASTKDSGRVHIGGGMMRFTKDTGRVHIGGGMMRF